MRLSIDRRSIAPLLLLAGLAATPAAAQTRVSESTGQVTLDAATRAEIVDSLISQVGAHYVEADTARMIGAAVRARAKAGAYDRLTDPYAFGEAVIDHMKNDSPADVIHANYWLSGLVGHRIKHELDVPFVSTFHTV